MAYPAGGGPCAKRRATGAAVSRHGYGHPMRRILLAVLALALFPASASAAPPLPFGHPCTPQNGVRFCPTNALTDRVASFDGVPLDVDVTLPPSGDGPFPTIVMLHGYGGNKANYETDPTEGATTYHWNANYFARRGYAVVNPSARGFGRSCGQPASRTPDCARGWIHLADQRYEARDTQHLLGLLADQGVARPGALGVTGISYGGGQSLELAFLRDRIRNPDGSFAPWRSPKGTPLSIAAAYPRWLWSDLVNALLPNGRFLDFRVSSATESREPIGVPIQSFISRRSTPPARRPASTRRRASTRAPTSRPGSRRIQAGEPYGADARAITDEIHAHPPGLRRCSAARRRRCCCTAAGPTTCSRPRSRCGSTTPCAPPTRARPCRCSSPTSATSAGPTRSTPTGRSTTRAPRSSTPTCAEPARRPRPAASPRSPRPARAAPPPAARSRRRAGPRCTRAR